MPGVDDQPRLDALYPPLSHTDLEEQTYQVLRDRILRRQLRPGERIVVEEIAEVAALEARDPQAVESALGTHISNVKARILAVLESVGGKP